jgi:hypothetical protein
MTKPRKVLLFVSGFCALVAIHYFVFTRSLGRSFGAAMSPNGEQSGFDSIVQSVFGFPFFEIDWIFRLPFDLSVVMRICTLLNGLFWASVTTIPIGFITRRLRQQPPRQAL